MLNFQKWPLKYFKILQKLTKVLKLNFHRAPLAGTLNYIFFNEIIFRLHHHYNTLISNPIYCKW